MPKLQPYEIDLVENIIQDLFKRQIRRKGLIKTGRLINSIDIDLRFNRQGVATITIIAVYYFEFLMWRYNIIDDVFGSSEFQDVLNVIGRFNIDFRFLD